jgi:6-pyruvoyltetrahydropterin/6-carboxytetrahydropterin synthase
VATSLTRSLRFEARHHLWVASWPEAENRARFGPLTEPHPHQYTCSVTVSGTADPHGMVVDLALLDRILEEEVRARLDGKHLNRDLPEFAAGTPLPTCEALAELLYDHIGRRLPSGVRLERVRVAEDESLQADRTGPA